MADVAISIPVARRVGSLVCVLDVFSELARSVVRNWQIGYQAGVWNEEMVAGRGTSAHRGTPAVQYMRNGCNTRERGALATVEVGYVMADSEQQTKSDVFEVLSVDTEGSSA